MFSKKAQRQQHQHITQASSTLSTVICCYHNHQYKVMEYSREAEGINKLTSTAVMTTLIFQSHARHMQQIHVT